MEYSADTIADILDEMDRFGGSFVTKLASLYRSADHENQAKILKTWANYFADYDKGEENKKKDEMRQKHEKKMKEDLYMLEQEGYKVEYFSPFHVRVNGTLDVFTGFKNTKFRRVGDNHAPEICSGLLGIVRRYFATKGKLVSKF